MNRIEIAVFHAGHELFTKDAFDIRELAENAEKSAVVRETLLRNFIGNKKFENVATVKSDDLERAYRLTNSIDYSWFDKDYIEFNDLEITVEFEGENKRSSSVGDIFVKETYFDAEQKNGAIADFDFYIVAPYGFVKLNTEETL